MDGHHGEGIISSNREHPTEPRGTVILVLAYLVLVVGIVASAVLHHQDYAQRFRAGVEQQLASIAALKVSELEQYRTERFRDAEIIFDNPVFSDLLQRFLENPTDSAVAGPLRSWLSKYPNELQYAGVSVFDASGVARLSIPELPFPYDAADDRVVADAMARGEPTLRDFYRGRNGQGIHLSILIPIRESTFQGQPIAVVVLRIAPEARVYPLISRWPTPSRTAETLLVRRDGDDVHFLNELKFRRDAALNLRIPLSHRDVPAVQAVLGRRGIVEGRDYRNEPVIAYLAAVPNSPWFMVARMDQSEVFAPLKQRLFLLIGMVVVLLLGAGAALAFVWRQRDLRFFREQAAGAAALKTLAAHQQVLLATVPDLILETDRSGVYSWSNQAGLDFFGEDVIGRRASLHDEFQQKTGSELVSQPDRDDKPVHVESWQRRRDGHLRLLAWRYGTFKQADGTPAGVLASARDITDQRRVEQELNARARIADILLTAPDDQMYHEVLRVILDETRSHIGVFGYINSADELVISTELRNSDSAHETPDAPAGTGRPIYDEDLLWATIREKHSTLSSSPADRSLEGETANTGRICVPLLLRGEAVGVFQVSGRDSDYADADLRLVESMASYVAPVLHARLQRQRHETDLQSRNDELLRFSYTVSHDLKSPLVTVTTFLGFLEKDIRSGAEQSIQKDFEFIRSATDRMSRLLEELLALTSVGHKKVPPVEVPLQTVVNEAMLLTAGQLTERRVAVDVIGEPLILYGERPRLVEVFQNLLDNAIKFMGNQPTPRVEIGGRTTPDGLALFVRDNGSGIDPRHRGKLFGLFEKLDPKSEGTGVGLALVSRIVQLHGGRIWVESDGVGAGATFWFTLARTRRATAGEAMT